MMTMQGRQLPTNVRMYNEKADIEWAHDVYGIPESAKALVLAGTDDWPVFLAYCSDKSPKLDTEFTVVLTFAATTVRPL